VSAKLVQGIAIVTAAGLIDLAEATFDSGNPVVYESYSSLDEPLRRFKSAAELKADIEAGMTKDDKFLQYCLHYQESLGHVAERKITLKQSTCGGHSWRWTVEGWGLIQFQADLKQLPKIECRIAVNSQKRAELWADTISELRSPALWDWQIVERHASRLIRRLKKLAKNSIF
jgi:hypothetical protein